jgi:hypothetical protein
MMVDIVMLLVEISFLLLPLMPEQSLVVVSWIAPLFLAIAGLEML